MDDETKLTLHGLQQHYVKLQDREKNRKLFDLLDALEFNQVCRWEGCGPGLLCSAASSAVGHHLCQERAALHRADSAAGRAELPSHLHPSWHASGGEVGGAPVCVLWCWDSLVSVWLSCFSLPIV